MGNYEKNIKKARSLYLEKGILKRELLRDDIVYSWVRSRLVNLSSNRPPAPSVPKQMTMTASQLMDRLMLEDYGLESVEASMEAYMIIDPSGNQLYAWTKDPTKRYYFNFNEDTFGTSGISLALKENVKSYAVGYEHYHDLLTEKITIGIPTSDGNTLGLILDSRLFTNDIELLISRLPEQIRADIDNEQQSTHENPTAETNKEIVSAGSKEFPACLQGCSDALELTRQRIGKLLNSPLIFIKGAKGIGKETTAHFIHQSRSNDTRLFHSVYCDKIPFKKFEADWLENSEKVVESLELYNIGTVYFENFNALPSAYQGKLLRIIDSKLVNTNTEDDCSSRDMRFIISIETAKKETGLETELTGSLQYRAMLSEISLPDLNSRLEDVCPIIRHMVSDKTGLASENIFIEDEALINGTIGLSFPSNLRDLDFITHEIAEQEVSPDKMLKVKIRPYIQAYMEEASEMKCIKTLEEVEAETITYTLRALDFNMVQCSKALGISRSTLYRKIEYYNINIEGVR